jgi:hypothetical protein
VSRKSIVASILLGTDVTFVFLIYHVPDILDSWFAHAMTDSEMPLKIESSAESLITHAAVFLWIVTLVEATTSTLVSPGRTSNLFRLTIFNDHNLPCRHFEFCHFNNYI